MPLPATIDATFNSLSWPDWKKTAAPPIEVGGNLYVLGLDKTLGNVEIWKSTDGGNTWSEQDAVNHKPLTTVTNCRTAAWCLDGTDLAVIWYGPNSSTVVDLLFAKFSTTTDTWGVTDTGAGFSNTTGDVTGAKGLAIVRRGADDYVAAYTAPTETIMGTPYRRVDLQRRTTGTWAVHNLERGLQMHQDLAGLVVGSSSRVHVIWIDNSSFDLKQRTFLSNNTFGTIGVLDASLVGTVAPHQTGIPVGYTDGADVKVVAPYVKLTTNDLTVARFTSADSPSVFTLQTVTATDPEVTGSNPAALAVDGTTVHAIFTDAATDDLWRDSDAGTGTWGTDVEQRDAITVQGINAAKITGAIGILYNDAGTVKFDTHSVATGPQTILRTLTVAQVSTVGLLRGVTAVRSSAPSASVATRSLAAYRQMPVTQTVLAVIASARAYIKQLAAVSLQSGERKLDVRATRSGAQTSTLSTIKRAYRDSIAATAGAAATARRHAARSALSTQTSASSVHRVPSRTPAAASVGTLGSLARLPSARRQAASAALASLVRRANLARLGSQSESGFLGRHINRILTAAQTEVATVASNRAYLRSLLAVTTESASLAKITAYTRALAAVVVQAATNRRASSSSKLGSTSGVGSLRRAASRTTATTSPESASLVPSQALLKVLQASLNESGAALRALMARRATTTTEAPSVSLRSNLSRLAAAGSVASVSRLLSFARTILALLSSAASSRRAVSRATTAAASGEASVVRYTEQKTTATAPAVGLVRRTLSTTRSATSSMVAAWFQGGFIAELLFPLKVKVMEWVASVIAKEPETKTQASEPTSTVMATEPGVVSVVQEPATKAQADESGSMIVEVNEEGSDS